MRDLPAEVLKRPFGSAGRQWVLDEYFDGVVIEPEKAWHHIYELLLWIDVTTGLGHCYESDKSQPGRHWYPRSLAFHKWLSDEFGVAPRALHAKIDHMFRVCVRVLMLREEAERAKHSRAATKQREPYKTGEMPEPGEYPDLEARVVEVLQEHGWSGASPEVARHVVAEVRRRLLTENKRKNLLGEGFEDAAAEVVRRSGVTASKVTASCRAVLSSLPGFRGPAANEKERTVDLAVLHKQTKRRTLVSVKWSVRADREEQFGVDYRDYARNEMSGEEFDFVLLTNEFDVARLVAACDRREHARRIFAYVVHICPEALAVVHADSKSKKLDVLHGHLESGRIIGVGDWLHRLVEG